MNSLIKITVCIVNFSFGCGEFWHDPVKCFWLKKWVKKCDDDSETSNWIAANTKVRASLYFCAGRNLHRFNTNSGWVRAGGGGQKFDAGSEVGGEVL